MLAIVSHVSNLVSFGQTILEIHTGISITGDDKMQFLAYILTEPMPYSENWSELSSKRHNFFAI